MKNILISVLTIVVAVAAIWLIISNRSGPTADLLLVNGNVHTLDTTHPRAEAIAVAGNSILAVGTTAELTSRYPAARQVDLHGATVLPGLVDGHAHVAGEGTTLEGINLVGTTSVNEILTRVADRVASLPKGAWALGRGWDQNDWETKAYPTHEVLTRISPDHPVVLRRIDGHALWANARAMALAGISNATPDTAGGMILRDAAGHPTGIFIDNAAELILRAIPDPTDADVERRILLAMNEIVRNGLTQVHDMGVNLQSIRVYKKLIAEGRSLIRIYGAIDGPGETWNAYMAQGPEIAVGGGMLNIRALKLYIDGALGSRGAALIDAYADDPLNRGVTIMSESEAESLCGQALRHGFQVCSHAIGDRGNLIMLTQYEQALAQLPTGTPSPRWRIEHAQVVRPADIERFARDGIIPAMQPTHATSDMYWAEERLGKERLQGAYAWRKFLNAGCRIIAGSDFPIEQVNPLRGFYAAITRMDEKGFPAGGWMPEERMTRDEALRSFTEWAAIGSFEEERKGKIVPGMWADLTILDRDIMTVPPEDILSTSVVLTMVGGKIVYQRQPDLTAR